MQNKSNILICGKFYVVFSCLTFYFILFSNIFPARSSSQNSDFHLFIFHHVILIFFFWLLIHSQDENFLYSLHSAFDFLSLELDVFDLFLVLSNKSNTFGNVLEEQIPQHVQCLLQWRCFQVK